MHKHLLCPERLRQVPEQFSWLDHRLISDHYLDICKGLNVLFITAIDAINGLIAASIRFTDPAFSHPFARMGCNSISKSRVSL